METSFVSPSFEDIKEFTDSQLLSTVTGLGEEKSDRLADDGLDSLLANSDNLAEAYDLKPSETGKVADLLQFAQLLDKAQPDKVRYEDPKHIVEYLKREGQLEGDSDKFILVMQDCCAEILNYKVFGAVNSMEELPKAEIIKACALQGAVLVTMVHYWNRTDIQPTYEEKFLQKLAVNLLHPLDVHLWKHIITNGTRFSLVKQKKELKDKLETGKGTVHNSTTAEIEALPEETVTVESEDETTTAQLLSRVSGIGEEEAQQLCHRGLFYLRAKAEVLGLIYEIAPEDEYRVLCTVELANRIAVSEMVGTRYTGPEQVFKLLRSEYLGTAQEHAFIVMLDQDKQIIGYKLVGLGTRKETFMSTLIVIKECLKCHAKYVINAHTHPSGNLRPSLADRKVNYADKDTLAAAGIQLLDDLVLTDQGYRQVTSLDEDWLKRKKKKEKKAKDKKVK